MSKYHVKLFYKLLENQREREREKQRERRKSERRQKPKRHLILLVQLGGNYGDVQQFTSFDRSFNRSESSIDDDVSGI